MATTARELERIFRTILMGCVPGAAAAFALAQAEAKARGGPADAGAADAGETFRWTIQRFDEDFDPCIHTGFNITRQRRVTATPAQRAALAKDAGLDACREVCGDLRETTTHRVPEGRTVVARWRLQGCTAAPDSDEVVCDDGAYIVETRDCSPMIGRRPAGLANAKLPPAPALGARLAAMAHLEAASVPAFRRLRHELAAHGAPRALRDACSRALRDEVGHARAMRRLARAHGGETPRVRVRSLPVRPLAELALENAVEGCVRETFGALVARYQAVHAAPEFRRVFARIARDEARHAALAWRIEAWVRPRLAPAARREVGVARRRAAAELGASSRFPVEAALGMPDTDVSAALVDACRRALWR